MDEDEPVEAAAFATVGDYEARYGDVEDPERIGVLLADASAFIAAYPGFVHREGDPLQAANLVRVACAVVRRFLSAGDLAGVSSYSQTAGSYTVQVSPANAGEDFYLTAADRRALGVGTGRVGQTRPYGEACDG